MFDLNHCNTLALLNSADESESVVPFRLHVPSGRLSGPTLKAERCFLGFDDAASSSIGRLATIAASFVMLQILVWSACCPNNLQILKLFGIFCFGASALVAYR